MEIFISCFVNSDFQRNHDTFNCFGSFSRGSKMKPIHLSEIFKVFCDSIEKIKISLEPLLKQLYVIWHPDSFLVVLSK